MEENLSKRIGHLTRMIEEYKKKATDRLLETRNTSNPASSVKENIQGLVITPQRTNVHVNPNFKPQNPVILINPKIPLKPLIHVNPRIMKTAITPDSTQTSTLIQNLKTHVDTLLNGKNISIPSERNAIPTIANKQNSVQTSIKKSVYVNPKLMKKLSSAAKSSIEKAVHPNTSPTQARLKALVKNVDSPKSVIKRSNSNIVMLSKNKLVRIKRGCSVSPGTKRSAVLSSQKTKILLRNSSSVTNALPKLSNGIRHSKLHVQNIRKINKYSINKTKNPKVKQKKLLEVSDKNLKNFNSTELIRIGGIVYKSTRNRLIRRSYPLKKKRLENINRNDKFLITTNGKKLSRLKIPKYNVNAANVTVKTIIGNKNTSKNIIRNKVKQKSIQILRNKMRKNNQPCLIFQRFGYCANEKNGTCHKLHDRKQVSVCKKFLQGKCLSDKCLLSHDVGPEKMPTCTFFLEGCCTRENCPYLHVKVSSKTPICIEFLKGYCAKGNECKKRHENLCPEFEKIGKCKKGKNCPYPHKPSNSSAHKLDNNYLQKSNGKTNESAKSAKEDNSTFSNHESTLRYYTKNTLTDFEEKKERIIKKMKIMQNVEMSTQSEDLTVGRDGDENQANEKGHGGQLLKRTPIGTLPAYIPIN